MRPLSVRNPRVARLARLARRPEERSEQRALLVEGPTLLAEALDAGVSVAEVFVADDATDSPALAQVLGRLPAAVDPWVVPRAALERAGDVATSQGLLAVVDRPTPAWPSPPTTDLVVVLLDVADPGNAGTIIRSAAAAGAGAVVAAGGVDLTAPKVVRSSAGAWFGLDVVTGPAASDALDRLATAGYELVGTVVRGGVPYDQVDLTGPVALVVGNEAHGLDAESVGRLHHAVTIPMAGATESLNVAMAATVVCFEALRQRRTRAAGS